MSALDCLAIELHRTEMMKDVLGSLICLLVLSLFEKQ